LERLDDIVHRVRKEHFLEGAPTEEELEAHLGDLIPTTLAGHVKGYSISGNVLTIYVADPISRQELSLQAPEICKHLNTRLGRNALGRIQARTQP
jgi:hypothetical protein